jgi:hypothetical protein
LPIEILDAMTRPDANGTRGAEQLYTRTTRTMRPPKATLPDLVPTPEDELRFAEAEAQRKPAAC